MSRLSLLLLAPLLALAACGANGDDASTGSSLADKVTREIREEMATENLDLGRGDDLPRAELTPEGELIIGGEPVGLDPSQRELAIAYRADVAAIAEHGARLGLEAAGLAKESIGIAIQGLFTGEGTAAVEENAKKKSKEIEVAALALCDRLPALHQSQQALAAAVPEFAPYAKMDQSDIDDCHVNVD
ncbi:hypothetical protein [Arenimonas donghaensis]|uniref:DUF2884 family protein n=1 Tax=Arenimonas donghaensis DSM 18148 = HO3-R19 TaxID=1121014 RepID=A0A087MMJ1_9GAMM|nr:hypothetical protein [Arenimonas donghaensis]KFL38094.1 hypothetical protein N788_02645 [Arenimonas donghaensis DSM 18148 = HO3-R19]